MFFFLRVLTRTLRTCMVRHIHMILVILVFAELLNFGKQETCLAKTAFKRATREWAKNIRKKYNVRIKQVEYMCAQRKRKLNCQIMQSWFGSKKRREKNQLRMRPDMMCFFQKRGKCRASIGELIRCASHRKHSIFSFQFHIRVNDVMCKIFVCSLCADQQLPNIKKSILDYIDKAPSNAHKCVDTARIHEWTSLSKKMSRFFQYKHSPHSRW